MSEVEQLAGDALTVLQLIGTVLALLLVFGVLASIARSTLRAAFGNTTLVLPFSTATGSPAVNTVLAEQLDEIENRFKDLSHDVRAEAGAISPDQPVSLVLRVLPDATLADVDAEWLIAQPISADPVGEITLFGVSISPDTIFALSYRLRAIAARRTVRGSLTEFDNTIRLSATFTYRVDRRHTVGAADKRNRQERFVITRALTDRSQVLNAIDDLAFCIVKVRIRFQSEAASWSVYQSFCRGFIDNLRFLQTGDTRCRERAVQHYQHAVDSEPGYLLARYNLANLLYNRYTQLDNSNAIEHFRVAAEQATDDELRALSLSGLTMAYCQNVHRFGLGADPWVDLATTSSETAIQIRPNLAEASLARAFAHQVAGNYPGAIEEYQHAASLPGDDPIGRQIRSFADNNRAWLYMTKRGDLDTALKILTDAAHLYPNKMIFANMGEAHLRRGDFEEALQAYNNALRLDPRYSNAINEAALVYLALASTASDDQTRTKYRIEADRWHHRALATLPPNVPEQRDAVERTFAEGVVRYAP